VFQKFWSTAGQSKTPLAQSALTNVGIVVQGAVMSQLLVGNEGAGPNAGIGLGFLIILMLIFAFLVCRLATE